MHPAYRLLSFAYVTPLAEDIGVEWDSGSGLQQMRVHLRGCMASTNATPSILTFWRVQSKQTALADSAGTSTN